jgi:hypothetical protein
MAGAVACKHPGINVRKIPRIKDGIAAATLVSLGARPIDFYQLRDPDSAVVEDFRRADFKARHDNEADFWLEYESPREKAREARSAISPITRAPTTTGSTRTRSHTRRPSEWRRP